MTDVLAERLSDKLRAVSAIARRAGCKMPATSRLYFSAACEGTTQYETFLLTPASNIKSVLLEARAAGIKPGDIDTQNFQSGHGESVCSLLEQLADAALQRQSAAFQTPTRQQQQPVVPAAYATLCEVSTDCTFDAAADEQAAARAWQLEADELEAQGLLSLPTAAAPQSWQANLAAMQAQAEQLQSLGLVAQLLLSRQEQEVTEDLRQLAEQQERLNVHFQPQLAELQAQQQGLEGLQQAEAAQREALAQAQDMVQHLSQELRQKKKQLRAAADEAGSRQVLKQMQEAVARLEGELADMGVQLGLLQHQVLGSHPVPGALPRQPDSLL